MAVVLSALLAVSFAVYGYGAESDPADTKQSETAAGLGEIPPAMPEGNGGPGGPPPEMPQGNGGPGGAPGGSNTSIDYSGTVEVISEETQTGQTYAGTAADENALLIATSDDVTIEEPTVTKSGDSDGGDNCNVYGLNAAVLVKD